MKIFIVILAVVGATLAAPQEDEDAELIPGVVRSARPRPPVRGDDDGFRVVFVPANPSTANGLLDILRAILGRTPRPAAPGGEEAPPTTSGGLPFGFPDIFRRFPFGGGSGFPDDSGFPEVPSDLPDNSTHEVKVINGKRMEMNTTTTKRRGDNGGIYITHIHTVRRLPGEGASPDAPVESDVELLQGDTAENEVASEVSL